jgi:acetyl-CoA carboxylase carboxyltransferase component
MTEELLAKKEKALLGGMDKINKQHEKGLVAARERIAMLAEGGRSSSLASSIHWIKTEMINTHGCIFQV